MTGASAEDLVISLGHRLDIGSDFVQMLSFNGSLCPCNGTDFCNDEEAGSVDFSPGGI